MTVLCGSLQEMFGFFVRKRDTRTKQRVAAQAVHIYETNRWQSQDNRMPSLSVDVVFVDLGVNQVPIHHKTFELSRGRAQRADQAFVGRHRTEHGSRFNS
jgi:hypothetical protein